MITALQIIYIACPAYALALFVSHMVNNAWMQSKHNVNLVNTVPTMGWADLRKLAKSHGVSTYRKTAYELKNELIYKLA